MFVEFQTYRFRAHSMFDPDLYRDPEEVERWKQRDPINTFADRLLDAGDLTADALEALWSAAREETEAAVIAAEAASDEAVETLLDHVIRPLDAPVDPVDPADPADPVTDDLDEVWP